MRQFSRFACVDWSGAKTERPPGIAVAQIGPEGPPALLSPDPRWSRLDIKHWLLDLAEINADILVGFDLSMGLPFHDEGHYFPQWVLSPADAPSLWELVDKISAADPHLGASTFINHHEASRHFRHSRERVGDLFHPGTGRLRVVEQYQRETGQGNSASCFNLVGAAQVGKSSLTGMRMLNQLRGTIPVWPFDPIPDQGPLIVEIYTSIAAIAAGLPRGRSKIRDRETLKAALSELGADTPHRLRRYDDHSTDALITAAWMKRVSADPSLWQPAVMTDEIARKEGWTFGVV